MNIGFPSCTIDVYPYEGGPYSFTTNDGILLGCQTRKNLNDPNSGRFTITLAPGGPSGPNASPQWVDILRPMSLVVIGMQRLGRTRIVMIGYISSAVETTAWNAGRPVRRVVQVSGPDFSGMFNKANFYASILLNFSGGAAAVGGSNSLIINLQLGEQNVSIQAAASAWFNKIMAGKNGLLSHTNFAYQGGRVAFTDLMATLFSNYPNLDVEIPVGQNFSIMQGTWMDTFRSLYPYPWFECFVTTAQSGDYGQSAAASPITLSDPAYAPASPALVSRPLPLPVLHNPDSLQLDYSLWEALTTYTLDVPGAINTTLEFTDVEVKNLYAVNPIYLGTVNGYTNDGNAQWMYLFGTYLDAASLERYGYRPFIANLDWFADPTGNAAQKKPGIQEFQKAVGDVTLKAAGYFEPAPLMASAQLTTNLRPDIIPGNKLRCRIGRDSEDWVFYIAGVFHTYEFGAPSVTTLNLLRGLPASVYDDDSLLLDIHTGNAQRVDGQYQSGLPNGSGAPLKVLNIQNGQASTAALANVYSLPGQK